jgi:hypothetical protein
MRTTVARIVRILEAPGVTTESLSLPPSLRPSTHEATSVSVASSSPDGRSQRSYVVAGFLAAGVLGALLFFRGSKHEAPVPAQASATATESEPSSAAPVVARSAAAMPAAPPNPIVVEPAPSSEKTEPNATLPAPVRFRNATEAHRPPAVAPEPRPTGAPPASSSATPPASSAPSAATPPAEASARVKPSPWVVDIVEERKEKSGAAP